MSNDDIVSLTAENKSLRSQLEEAKGALSLSEDEYVKQVGTWKIIQRLEEQLAQAEQQLAELRDAAEAATTSNQVLGPPARTKLRQVLDQCAPDTTKRLTCEVCGGSTTSLTSHIEYEDGTERAYVAGDCCRPAQTEKERNCPQCRGPGGCENCRCP